VKQRQEQKQKVLMKKLGLHAESNAERKEKLKVDSSDDDIDGAAKAGPQSHKSLLSQAEELKRAAEENPESAEDKLKREEAKLLEALNAKKLLSHAELAHGVVYTESLKTSWTPPRRIANRSAKENQAVRDKWHILVDGDNAPPPVTKFSVRFCFLLANIVVLTVWCRTCGCQRPSSTTWRPRRLRGRHLFRSKVCLQC